jgi:hypothetical protein
LHHESGPLRQSDVENEATGEWGTEAEAETKLASLKDALHTQLKKVIPDLEITTREEDQ